MKQNKKKEKADVSFIPEFTKEEMNIILDNFKKKYSKEIA